MNENEMSPLEKVLRLIAAAAPQPWFPRRYAEQTRFPLDVLLYYLEHLWLDGLLRRGEATAEGTGLHLSPAGEEVLRDPEMQRRLRDGDPLRPDDRGCVVRSVFRRPRRASLTRLLLWLNILWFGWGVYLAHKVNAGRAFLSTFEQPNPSPPAPDDGAARHRRRQSGRRDSRPVVAAAGKLFRTHRPDPPRV